MITRYEYSLVKSGENVDAIYFTTDNSFTRTNLTNGDYTLTVSLSSWNSLVVSDAVSFVVDIPNTSWWWGWGWWGGWWWGWGWWGGWSSSTQSSVSSKNKLSLSIDNKNPSTNERIKIIVNTDEKYTWRVDFIRMQYYSNWGWVNFSMTTWNFISDYSDELEAWYVRFSSSDKWKIELPKFIKLSRGGTYRFYAEDKDWDADYVQFDVWKLLNDSTNVIDTEEEVYISRSCKKYTIKYNSDLWVFTSPDLLKSEYFVNKDYFKRYIDSKNRQVDGCPTNVWWISTQYRDTSKTSDRYVAPNGKVYFILLDWWKYYSKELNYELKTPTSFNTIQDLKYYIRDRNPFISMVDDWAWTRVNIANDSKWNYENLTSQSHGVADDVTYISSNSFNTEYNEAYQFAYKNWITTMWSIEKANMNWNLTRIAMAKMLSYYATNVLWSVIFKEVTPKFSDVSQALDDSYWWAVTLAYQLWIMWQNMPDNRFRPNDLVTRAEFATALSRMLYSTADWNPYYSTHLQKLYNSWIITNTNPNLHELRWYVMIMLMRSAKK